MFILLFLCNLLIPAILLIGGWLLYYRTPKTINLIYGYRTGLSMKNQDTWNFANKMCGRVWLCWGGPLFALSLLVQLFFIYASEDAFVIMTLVLEGIQLVVIFASIYVVQKAMKQTFDKDGNRM